MKNVENQFKYLYCPVNKGPMRIALKNWCLGETFFLQGGVRSGRLRLPWANRNRGRTGTVRCELQRTGACLDEKRISSNLFFPVLNCK